MASLLERLNVPPVSSVGPVRRTRSAQSAGRSATAPYNRSNKAPKGNPDAPWSHDLYESHNSLSARISSQPAGAPKANLNALAQKALRDATSTTASGTTKNDQGQGLSIKGASSSALQGNVVQVSGLAEGTTTDDVAFIFKRCGPIASVKVVSARPGGDVTMRVTFKTTASANSAVQKFDKQEADEKILSVKIVGSSMAGTTLSDRLGGPDGLGLVRDEGTVDVLMNSTESASKMRSDAIIQEDPRALVLVAPPGTNPSEYVQPAGRGGRRGGRGRGGRRGGRRGGVA